MSSGQSSSHTHSRQLVDELKRYLADDKVKAYMARPYRVDRSRRVLYTGGSSVDGRTYYIDPDVPTGYVKFVLQHERVEKALREVLGMGYATAHKFATVAERWAVEVAKRRWDDYNRVLDPIVRKNEARRGDFKMPPGFDLGPYKESHDSANLRKMRDG